MKQVKRNCANCKYKQRTDRKGYYGFCGLWYVPIKDSYSGCQRGRDGQMVLRNYVVNPLPSMDELKYG